MFHRRRDLGLAVDYENEYNQMIKQLRRKKHDILQKIPVEFKDEDNCEEELRKLRKETEIEIDNLKTAVDIYYNNFSTQQKNDETQISSLKDHLSFCQSELKRYRDNSGNNQFEGTGQAAQYEELSYNLKQALLQAKKELNDARAINVQLQNENEGLNAVNTRLHNENAGLNAESLTLRNENAHLRTELTNSQHTAGAFQKSNSGSIEQIRELQQRNKDLEEEIETLQATIRRQVQQLVDYQAKDLAEIDIKDTESSENLAANLAQVQQTLKATQQQLDASQKDVHDLQRQLEKNIEQNQQNLQGWQAQEEELRRQLAESQQQQQALQGQITQNTALYQQDIALMQEQNHALEQQLAARQAQEEQQRKVKEVAEENLVQEIADLRNELLALQASNNTVKEYGLINKQMVDTQSQVMKRLVHTVNVRNNELTRYDHAYQNLQRQYVEDMDHVQKIVAQEQMQGGMKIAKLNEELGRIRDHCLEVIETNTRLHEENAQLQSDRQDLLNVADEAIRRSQESGVKNKEKIQLLTGAIESLDQACRISVIENQELRQERDSALERIELLQKQVKQCNATKERMTHYPDNPALPKIPENDEEAGARRSDAALPQSYGTGEDDTESNSGIFDRQQQLVETRRRRIQEGKDQRTLDKREAMKDTQKGPTSYRDVKEGRRNPSETKQMNQNSLYYPHYTSQKYRQQEYLQLTSLFSKKNFHKR